MKKIFKDNDTKTMLNEKEIRKLAFIENVNDLTNNEKDILDNIIGVGSILNKINLATKGDIELVIKDLNEFWGYNIEIIEQKDETDKMLEIVKDVRNHRLNTTKLYLLSCLDYLNDELAIEQMNFCYDLWLSIDYDISLSRLADIVTENWIEIENGKMSDDEIIDELVGY